MSDMAECDELHVCCPACGQHCAVPMAEAGLQVSCPSCDVGFVPAEARRAERPSVKPAANVTGSERRRVAELGLFSQVTWPMALTVGERRAAVRAGAEVGSGECAHFGAGSMECVLALAWVRSGVGNHRRGGRLGAWPGVARGVAGVLARPGWMAGGARPARHAPALSPLPGGNERRGSVLLPVWSGDRLAFSGIQFHEDITSFSVAVWTGVG